MNQTYRGAVSAEPSKVVVTGEEAGRGRLLPLLVVPQLVGRTGKCIQPVKARGREVHQRRGQRRCPPQDEKSYRKFCKACGGHLLTDHPLGGRRRVRSYDPDLSPRAAASCQLRGDGAPHQRRPAQDEGYAQGDGRVGRDAPGIAKPWRSPNSPTLQEESKHETRCCKLDHNRIRRHVSFGPRVRLWRSRGCSGKSQGAGNTDAGSGRAGPRRADL